MGDKVLVGCIASKDKAWCLEDYKKALDSQDFKDFDLLFIHDGKDSDFVSQLEKMEGTSKIDSADYNSDVERRVAAREALKRYAVDKGYSHLLFLDPNIVLPENGISRMLYHKKDILSGVYLTNMKVGDKHVMCPTLFDFAQDGLARIMELKEVMADKLIEISCAGLGCCLIDRKVLENTTFRFFERSMAGDDIAFFMDSRDNGFETFADTKVKCNNQVSEDNPRQNSYFSFDAYPKIRNPRVLVGCVTHDKDEVYLKGFLESVRSQDYPNMDILFVDTSEGDEYSAKLKGTGSIVQRYENDELHKIMRITGGRNLIREYAIKNNYDYVLFVDTDVRPPPNALSKLLAARKDVVAGLCLISSNFNGSIKIASNTYDFDNEEGFCRPKFIPTVLNDDLVEVQCAGFGCTLTTVRVLEDVPIRYYEKSMAGEDIAFFIDVREKGWKTWADNSVKCGHLVFPPGDPRNRKFYFESYEKGDSYTFNVEGSE